MALVPSSLVAMDDALVDHRVDDGAGNFQIGRSFFFVTRVHRVRDALDGGAELRSQRHVMGAALDRLTGSLFG